MRKVFSVALMASLVCLIGMSRDAGAVSVLDMVWVSHNGSVIDTDSVTAAPGDILTMEMRFIPDQDVAILGWSVFFDTDGENELNIIQVREWTGYNQLAMAMNAQLAVTLLPSNNGAGTLGGNVFTDSTAVIRGQSLTYESGTLGDGLPGPTTVGAQGTYIVGTIVWQVNNPTTDGDDIFTGAFNSGVDGTFNADIPGINLNNTIDFQGASVNVNVIPEPGTASLLGLGLVGLILAGRRGRRS